jgi:hypothetical protein
MSGIFARFGVAGKSGPENQSAAVELAVIDASVCSTFTGPNTSPQAHQQPPVSRG